MPLMSDTENWTFTSDSRDYTETGYILIISMTTEQYLIVLAALLSLHLSNKSKMLKTSKAVFRQCLDMRNQNIASL